MFFSQTLLKHKIIFYFILRIKISIVTCAIFYRTFKENKKLRALLLLFFMLQLYLILYRIYWSLKLFVSFYIHPQCIISWAKRIVILGCSSINTNKLSCPIYFRKYMKDLAKLNILQIRNDVFEFEGVCIYVCET